MRKLIPENLKSAASRYLTNLRGWSTDRKIVVIESDDWGSIRMPSRKVYEKCLNSGYRVDANPYEKYDSLASEDDLELLFNLLSSFKDGHGRNPIITANALVANPDYLKIEESGFKEYYYESITDTFNNYPNHSNCFSLWNAAADRDLMFFQSHGREHLNVSDYMNALQQGDKDAHFSFQNRMPGCIPANTIEKARNKFVEAIRFNGPEDKEQKLDIIVNGLNLFKDLFGYYSESFIPPNYYWSPDFNEKISQLGVSYIQGQRKFKELMNNNELKYHSNYLGKNSDYGQVYLQRNATFEPSLFDLKIQDPVDKCLSDISIAFTMNRPAVICSHRINFVGTIDTSNRDRSLQLFKELLGTILKKWPDVEFLTSVELGYLIKKPS